MRSLASSSEQTLPGVAIQVQLLDVESDRVQFLPPLLLPEFVRLLSSKVRRHSSKGRWVERRKESRNRMLKLLSGEAHDELEVASLLRMAKVSSALREELEGSTKREEEECSQRRSKLTKR